MKTVRHTSRTAIFLVVMLFSSVAGAQIYSGTGALKLDPVPRELGLKAGNFNIQPYLNVGYGYDSNLFYNDDTQWEKPTGSQLVKIVPGLKVINLNTRNLELNFGGSALIDQYISDNKAAKKQSNVGGDAKIAATFFKASPVSLRVSEQFRRALERRNSESNKNYNRNVNRVGAGVVFKPGGGALEMGVDYAFVADMFADVEDDWGDLLYHDITLKGSWKFFPYTALVLDGNWQARSYEHKDMGRYGELTPSKPLRVRFGLNGFITRKLSVMALVGYGNSFHEQRVTADLNPSENDSFNMVIGEARVSARFSPNTIVQGGYQFDFKDSTWTNYVQYHKFYVNFQQRLLNRVDLVADVSYFIKDYSQLPKAYFEAATDKTIAGSFYGLLTGYERRDLVLHARLKAVVDITRFLAFEASYNMELNNEPLNSSGKFGTCMEAGCEDPATFRDYVAYKRHFVLGSLILRY